MNTQIQTVNFNADVKLLDHVNKRVDKLRTFHDNIMKVEVYLKLDNVVHQVKDKVAEIKVTIPKHSFFVKSESKVFEESFDTAYDALVTQIKRKKEKDIKGFASTPEYMERQEIEDGEK
jgi:putative sigma-54 modulation protein